VPQLFFFLLLFGLFAGFLFLTFFFILFSAFVSHRVPPFFVRLTVFPSMVAPSTPIGDREQFFMFKGRDSAYHDLEIIEPFDVISASVVSH
jgi:hypothetical protein